MQDQILNTDGAVEVLEVGSATLFRLIRKRAIPFLRVGFGLNNPRGNLYFSKLRLKDKSWGNEHNMERDSIRKEELKERGLAIELADMTLEYELALIKNTDGKLPREQRDEAAEDMYILERTLQPLRDKVWIFQKQRIWAFFSGSVVAIKFFKDSYFVGEYKKLENSRHDFYPGHIVDEDKVRAVRLGQEAADKLARKHFAEQEKKRLEQEKERKKE